MSRAAARAAIASSRSAAQSTESMHARAVLLHLDRLEPDVGRARGEQPLLHVAVDLRVHVVDVRLDQQHRRPRRLDRLAEPEPQHVRPVLGIAAAGAVADAASRASPGARTSRAPSTSAAPVGVTSSIGRSPRDAASGAPALAISSSVAGAGTGSTPCAERAVPPPAGSGEQYSSLDAEQPQPDDARRRCRRSRRARRPRGSRSPRARRRGRALRRRRAAGRRPTRARVSSPCSAERSMMRRMSGRRRCGCGASARSTCAFVAAMPARVTRSARSVQPSTPSCASSARSASTSRPASSSAPSSMSPLMPEKQSR